MKYTESTYVRAIYNENNKLNPFLSAMPDILPRDIFFSKLCSTPTICTNIHEIDGEKRRQMLAEINNIFLPMDYMYTIYDLLYRAIISTYNSKNIIDIIRKICQLKNGENLKYTTQAISGSILGVPGVGKTSTIKRCLSLLPQVIEHVEFNDSIFYKKQILYLHIECPSDCSIKTLAYNIISAVDRAIGSEYFSVISRQSKISASALATQVKIICLNHVIGLIVVDEIQNTIRTAEKNHQIKPLIKFLVELLNDTCTSVYFVGTMEADEVFQQYDHLKRRTRGIRLLPMRPDATYRNFLSEFWRYQLVLNKSQLTDKTSNKIYDYSGGIPSYIVQIFVEAQAQAIICGIEQLNEKVVQKAVNLLCISVPKSYPMGVSLSDFDVHNISADDINIIDTPKSEPRAYANARGRKKQIRSEKDLIEILKSIKQSEDISKHLISIGIGEEVWL